MTLLYFAWVRQKLGVSEERLDLPAGVCTIHELADHLRSRGGAYESVFGDPYGLRAAVNQEHARWDAPVRSGDEVAFFPPVTGG